MNESALVRTEKGKYCMPPFIITPVLNETYNWFSPIDNISNWMQDFTIQDRLKFSHSPHEIALMSRE